MAYNVMVIMLHYVLKSNYTLLGMTGDRLALG